MSEVTTEQFLLSLGVEVGKPFKAVGKRLNGIYIIVYFKETFSYLQHYSVFDFNMDEYEEDYGNSLEVLLDCKITPLPKYTLSEDEKAIVRNLEEGIGESSVVRRADKKNLLIIVYYIDGSQKARFRFPYAHLFTFIKEGESVTFEELRKCL